MKKTKVIQGILDCDYGLGIITRGIPGNTLNLSPQEIDAMTYKDLARDRGHLLNLRSPACFYDFMRTV